jgi:hypothetical protein
MKWGLENGREWCINDSYDAAGNGHLETLKWVRSKGAPWHKANVNCERRATEEGHHERRRSGLQRIAAQTTVLPGGMGGG